MLRDFGIFLSKNRRSPNPHKCCLNIQIAHQAYVVDKKDKSEASFYVQLHYALALLKCCEEDCIVLSLRLLEELYHRRLDDLSRLEVLYYLCIAHFKLKEIETALRFCDAVLSVEPRNGPVRLLRYEIISTLNEQARTRRIFFSTATVTLLVSCSLAAIILLRRQGFLRRFTSLPV